MNLLRAFFRLIRWPNLLFIILTQVLFYFCIYQPLFDHQQPYRLLWIVVASVLIAAGGYIINDYFDMNIDQVNKPGKNVFTGSISRRWAIIWHLALSAGGVIATALAVGFAGWYLILANFGCVFLLWIYSTSLKRRFLIGNIVISLLTAWTVLILFFALAGPDRALDADPETIQLFRRAFLYGGFAFLVSLVREAIKDMEDLEGDLKYGCRTLPIVAGIKATRVYSIVISLTIIGALIVLELYILQFRWWWAILYMLLFVILPLVSLIRSLRKADTSVQFSKLSSQTKLIMLTGILSMVFFFIYAA